MTNLEAATAEAVEKFISEYIEAFGNEVYYSIRIKELKKMFQYTEEFYEGEKECRIKVCTIQIENAECQKNKAFQDFQEALEQVKQELIRRGEDIYEQYFRSENAD